MALIHIWGDESSQNGHQYMVLGTIWQNPICAADLERDVNNLKQSVNFMKEFHWTEMKGHHVSAYRGLVEIFKEYMNQGLIKFRALVVDQTDRSHRLFSDTDELHFYKMFFWLITKRLNEQNRYDVFLDRKSNSVPGRLSDLKDTLNGRFRSDQWANKNKIYFGDVVRRVEPRSGVEVELQLADVFAGAIAYVVNGFFEKGKSNEKNPKVILVKHILDLGFPFQCHKSWENPSFNIWCFERTKI